VHIGRVKLLDDFYVIEMDKDPATPLLVGRGFLATANAVIYYKIAMIAVGEGVTRSIFRVKEVDLGDEEIPYWTTLGNVRLTNLELARMEYEDLIENPINWNRPPKDGDGAWHAKIELIDLDDETFKKTFQSIPTTRKLSQKESPGEIIDLDHFHSY
ncbi:hypothetical protein Tco_1513582, partial [Tanacetum coccineum]